MTQTLSVDVYILLPEFVVFLMKGIAFIFTDISITWLLHFNDVHAMSLCEIHIFLMRYIHSDLWS